MSASLRNLAREFCVAAAIILGAPACGYGVFSPAGSFQPDLSAALSVLNSDFTAPAIEVLISGNSTLLTEGGAGDQYSLVLSTRPASDVVITIAPDSQLLVNGSAVPIALTFTPEDHNVPRTIMVNAVDDHSRESSHEARIIHTVTTEDPVYAGLRIPDVEVSITDNDTPGVSITQAGGTTDIVEGGATDAYTIVLLSSPAMPVSLTITPDAQTTINGSSAPLALTFDSNCPGVHCWSMPRTLTAAAADDSVVEGMHIGTIAHGVSSADPDYDGILIPSVTASISDNDTAGVTITQSGGSTNVVEGGATDTYTIVLTSSPAAPVTIALTPDTQSTVNGSPAPVNLTFDSTCPGANCWSDSRTVTVGARNDSIAEGGHGGLITHGASSADANYHGIGISNVVTAITDNDTAGVIITESGGSTGAGEAGGTDTYTIRLATEPIGNVTVTITPDGQTMVNGSTSPINFSFDNVCPGADCWSTNKTVTAAARNDSIAEGGHNGTVTHSASSSDSFYNGIGIGSVTVSITDNDSVGFIQPVTAGQTTDAAGIAQFNFRLNSQPTGTVTIGLSSSNTGEGSVSPSSLTFNAGNWNVNQTITVTGVNDDTYNGNMDAYSIITAAATGTDTSGYVGLDPADYSMTNVSRDYLTFLSSSPTTGGNLGGVAGADSICMADRPPALAGKTVKAMLVYGMDRRACTSANCGTSGTAEHIDWVLQPNATYFRIDGTTIIGSTNQNGVFPYVGGADPVPSINQAFIAPADYYVTGLRFDWRTTTTGKTCSGYTSNSPGQVLCGQGTRVNHFAYGWINCSCAHPSHHVLCVEQP